MRHRKAGRKLKRTASHRRALLSALSTQILRHKRVTTTLAKAKEARSTVERLITKAKRALVAKDSPAVGVHQRRQVGRFIKDREVVTELFNTIAPRFESRQGGYTRVVKLGQRFGDGAQMAVIELVDFMKPDEEKKESKEREEPKKKAESKKDSKQQEKKPRSRKAGKEETGEDTSKKKAPARKTSPRREKGS